MAEKPKEAWETESAKLEKIAGNTPLELGIRRIQEKDSLTGAVMTFDSKQGDKGLSYLAKRMYKKFRGLSDADALKAAVLLSSLFLKQAKQSNIELHDGDTLRITGDRAILIGGKDSNFQVFDVDLGERGLREIEEKREQVMQASSEKRKEIQEEVADTVETALAKRPLKKLLRENFGEEFLPRLKDKSYPEHAMEAYEFTFNNQKYYVAAVLALRQREYGPKIPIKSPKFRLTKGTMVDKTEVDWTTDFSKIMDSIK